jgi:hypothetical protein
VMSPGLEHHPPDHKNAPPRGPTGTPKPQSSQSHPNPKPRNLPPRTRA